MSTPRETLTALAEKLPLRKFLRISRSIVVNLDRIKELQPLSHGEYAVILSDRTKLTLSRSYRDTLQQLLGKIHDRTPDKCLPEKSSGTSPTSWPQQGHAAFVRSPSANRGKRQHRSYRGCQRHRERTLCPGHSQALSTPRQKFVTVNWRALPDTLLESELFGYKAGAFTDARRDKPGRFASANGGTIFLDEIGDISPAMQVRLLRVLQERISNTSGIEPVKTDVRIVAATNKDLGQQVRTGQFREDLYYRINVMRIELPASGSASKTPPADRALPHRFNKARGRSITGLSPAAFTRLMSHSFPGTSAS